MYSLRVLFGSTGAESTTNATWCQAASASEAALVRLYVVVPLVEIEATSLPVATSIHMLKLRLVADASLNTIRFCVQPPQALIALTLIHASTVNVSRSK